MSAARQNRVRYVRWASLATIAAAFLLLLRVLPVDRLFEALQVWVGQFGFWGPAIFAAVYAVAATLLLPASALTLAAGAVFGLGTGVVTVWAGAVMAVALSFLIARYFARARVERLAGENPKFGAIDKALGEEGWKIVALLRLSPVFPFNVQNYLYGVSSIRFGPCVIASAVFMLPGTFMYVYFGYIGGQAAAAASGGGADAAKLALQGVGLAATVLVTLYIARVASRAVKKHAAVGEEPAVESGGEQPTPASLQGAAILAAAALLLFAAALYAYRHRAALKGWFHPPVVELRETYANDRGAATVDHSAFDRVARGYVDEEGFVDYAALNENAADLDAYIAMLAKAPFDRLDRDGKLALLINAYNAFTLRLILDNYPLDSIEAIPEERRWTAVRWNIAGGAYSLDQIEHEWIRPNFREPRIHFALVCAAVGCPPLRNEAYVAGRLETQLEDQTRKIHSGGRWFGFDEGKGEVSLTQFYRWYRRDFEQVYGSPLAAVSRYSTAVKKSLDGGRKLTILWLDYDWSLNERRPSKTVSIW